MYEHLHGVHGVEKPNFVQIASMFTSLQALPRAVIKATEAALVHRSGADPISTGEVDGIIDDKMDDSETEDLSCQANDDSPVIDLENSVNGAVEMNGNKAAEKGAQDEQSEDKDSEQVGPV